MFYVQSYKPSKQSRSVRRSRCCSQFQFRCHDVVIKFKCRNGNEKIHFRLKIDDYVNNAISPLSHSLRLRLCFVFGRLALTVGKFVVCTLTDAMCATFAYGDAIYKQTISYVRSKRNGYSRKSEYNLYMCMKRRNEYQVQHTIRSVFLHNPSAYRTNRRKEHIIDLNWCAFLPPQCTPNDGFSMLDKEMQSTSFH